MSRRVAAGLLGSVALALGGVLVAGSGAAAQAPDATGWWSFASRAGQQAPPPPDMQEGDLLVQGGDLGGAAPDLGLPTAPTAVAALRFTVPDGATVGPLSLAVGDGAQAADVRAYPVKNDDWKPSQGGPLADAPEASPQRYSSGVLDGAQLVFRDIARLLSDEGRLSVVLIPGAMDRVVIKKPTTGALAVTAEDAESGGFVAPPPSSSDGGAAAPVTDGGEIGTGAAPPPALGSASIPAPPADGGVVPPAVAAGSDVVTAPPPAAAAAPASTPASFDQARADADQRTRYLVALEALLVVATFGLLGWGPLSRLSALTGHVPAEASSVRGVGRFARERSGEVVRL